MFSSNIVSKKYNNKRLDLFLVGIGIVKSRQRAVSLIMNGNVYITDKKIDKPGKIIRGFLEGGLNYQKQSIILKLKLKIRFVLI